MTTLHTVSFQKTVLASLVGLCLSQSVFALQEISDAGLSETTGEGVAMLPENFSMQLNGADTANSGAGGYGAGYIRFIPVGPLTQTSQDTNADGSVNTSDHSVGKADLYLYGLSLAQSKKDYAAGRSSTDWGVGFGDVNTTTAATDFGRPITSWGSAENPWLLKVATEQNVPDFAAPTPTATSAGSVSYLMLEAPLFNTATSFADLTAAEKSAYNLKMGLWTDVFVRDPTKIEGDADQFRLGQMYGGASASRENRLRLQAVLDGFSVNGTSLKIFQTLGGVTSGNTQGLSTSYNNTFGVAGLVRLNSGDAANLKATYTAATRYYGGTVTNGVYTGGGATTAVDSQYVQITSGLGSGCGNASNAFGVGICEYRFRSRNVSDVVSNGSWIAPTASSVLRLSTRETSDSDVLATPALGGAMPVFDQNEGLYLYNPNVNLVLGSLYQPLTFGVATDGKNFTMELARIPNKESIYKKIYTNYDDSNPVTNGGYTGSTCNIYQCGDNGIAGYQGNNATHSSITIGSTVYDAATNRLTALKDNGSVGVSFGVLTNRTGINTSKSYVQWQDQQRQLRRREFNWTDNYRVKDKNNFFVNDAARTDPYTGLINECDEINCDRNIFNNGNINKPGGEDVPSNPANPGPWWVQTSKGYHLDWVYRQSGNADVGGTCTTYTGVVSFCGEGGEQTDAWIIAKEQTDSDDNARDYTGRATTTANLSWENKGANWADSTAKSLGVIGKTLDKIPTNASNSINMSPTNNFGSVAIDGLLIQHLKFTTKGL